jgi:alkylation response protein AidB-like acyl-CoA dehydrogenase
MNFDFTEEEKELARQARRMLSERSPPSLVRALLDGRQQAAAAALWDEAAGLGWSAIAIAEQDGGVGFGHVGLCALAEEVGRALAPLPLLSSIYLAAQALAAGGSAEQRATWLPHLAAGEVTGAAAIDPVAPPLAWAGGRLDGSVAPVAGGFDAAVAVVSARHQGASVLVVVALDQPGVSRSQVQTLDDSRPQARLVFDGAAADLLGTGELSAEMALARAAVPIAFEQVGGADACLETTLAFVRERRSFGRPVGSYQAVKHRLADMYVANQLARSNAYYAAWALAANAPELMLAAATARVSATEAYEFAAAEAIQLHGGIGFTWEADCHLHYRRSRVLAQIIEPLPWWQDRLARALVRSEGT